MVGLTMNILKLKFFKKGIIKKKKQKTSIALVSYKHLGG
jgi:hypothetical protein